MLTLLIVIAAVALYLLCAGCTYRSVWTRQEAARRRGTTPGLKHYRLCNTKLYPQVACDCDCNWRGTGMGMWLPRRNVIDNDGHWRPGLIASLCGPIALVMCAWTLLQLGINLVTPGARGLRGLFQPEIAIPDPRLIAELEKLTENNPC